MKANAIYTFSINGYMRKILRIMICELITA